MHERALKSGNGLLWGVSNNKAQPGLMLWLFDGEIVLGALPLDEAFPDRVFEVEFEGVTVKVAEPGAVLNMVFTRELRMRTDGEDLDIKCF